jgi:chloramphenicol-sensitive protein RarD
MLKEKLRWLQWISVALAAIGVIILTVGYGSLPWIALVLAVTWGMYGLLKKTLNAGALETLSIETLFTLTPNFIYLMLIESQGRAAFGHGWATTLLLIFGGGATIAPLLMWNGAVLRLPLSVIGLLQYLTPTIMFFIGIYANHEDMSVTKLFGFMFIWSALILLGTDAVKNSRNSSAAVEDL